ncbi:AAA family ATPase [Pseudomonas sp. S1(2024)]|uniref:AAA family ATPase n=1 Tax=Pseudomonas sp. S1(2024) TaxID=3390191 RepID=UPI00397A6DB5
MTVAQREELLNLAFRPHYPIEDPDSFFGREMEAARVVQALHSPGQHVVIYGERGAGKTSLARVSTIGHARIDVFCESESSFSKIARDVVLKCQADASSKIVYDAATNKVSINGVMRSLDELDGNSLKALLPAKRLVLVFDEVDRLPASTIADLGEFTKNVATDLPQVTLIFVGVGATVSELLRGHESVFRNIRSVGLGKFDQDATIQAILDKGGKTLGLEFSAESVSSIVSASDRYPYYVQLLGITSARLAMIDGATAVTQQHVTSGAESAAQDADESLRDAYEAAILSSRSDVYRFVLWGLANLDNRVEGSVGQIAEVASRYASLALSPQVVGAALNKLALDVRGGIVAKRVMGPKKTFYSFNHPLMRGFVRLRVINASKNGA